MADLVSVLESTISPDTAQLQEANRVLEQAAQQNVTEFMFALAQVLANANSSDVARQAAGLYLKNCLTSNDEVARGKLHQRWLAVDKGVRIQIKDLILNALGTENVSPSQAAQCVAAIAAAEIPHQQWPYVLRHLYSNVTTAEYIEKLKEASFEALSYICEDVSPSYLAGEANLILTAVIQGMKKEEPSQRVRLSATKALYNSLELTNSNFEQEHERHYIMQVVCEATQCPENEKIRVSALQCIVKIMSMYYQHMETYMGPALFAISLSAIKSQVEEESLQGIEFWSTVCDEETDLAMEAAEAEEMHRLPSRTSRHYIKGSLGHLIPLLLPKLAQQEEFDNEDDWTPSKAAGVCLMLISSCVGDDLVKHVTGFIASNISNAQDWRLRDAAAFTLGAVVEGPSPSSVEPVVKQTLFQLINLMKDEMVNVRDTAAWSLGRISQILQEMAIDPKVLEPLLQALVEGLDMEPRVATNSCWALSSLGEAAYEVAEVRDDEEEPRTYALSPNFAAILDKLVKTADRQDAGKGNLRGAAYEALGDFIKNSPLDCYDVVRKMALLILERLSGLLQINSQVVSAYDRSHLNDLASLLCATMQSLLRKVNPIDAEQISQLVMDAMFKMLDSSIGKTGGVQDDAIATVGVVIQSIGMKFATYIPKFKNYLIQGLRNTEEYQVCITAVGVVTDLCRAFEGEFKHLMPEIMVIFVENLSNPECHRSVKPHILSAIGDMALVCGTEFQSQLNGVFLILQQAAQLTVDKSDYNMLMYQTQLRDGCLEAYTGILQGLKGDNDTRISADVQLMVSQVPFILNFLKLIAEDDDKSDENTASSAGLIGDLIVSYGNEVKSLIPESVVEMLEKGKISGVDRTQSLCGWALSKIRPTK